MGSGNERSRRLPRSDLEASQGGSFKSCARSLFLYRQGQREAGHRLRSKFRGDSGDDVDGLLLTLTAFQRAAKKGLNARAVFADEVHVVLRAFEKFAADVFEQER